MTHHPNLKILIFIGSAGSGKSTAVHHFTEKGFPKVSVDDSDDKVAFEKTSDQVHHLANAGQHRIVIDDISGPDEYRALKHAFPGEMTTVALAREHNENETTAADDPVPNTDYFVVNDDSIENLYKKLDAIAHEIDFN